MDVQRAQDVAKRVAVRHQSKGQRQDVVLFLTQTGFLKARGHFFSCWSSLSLEAMVGVVAGRYSVRQHHLRGDAALIKQCYKDRVLVYSHTLTKAVQVNKPN